VTSAVSHARGVEFVLDAFQQHREVWPRLRGSGHRGRGHVGDAEIGHRPRQRSREPRRRGDVTKIREAPFRDGVEGGPRGDGFSAEQRCRGNATARQRGGGDPRRELRQAESRQAERGAAGDGEPAREIIGRPTCGGNNRDRLSCGELFEERGSGVQADHRRCRSNETKRVSHVITPGAVPGNRLRTG